MTPKHTPGPWRVFEASKINRYFKSRIRTQESQGGSVKTKIEIKSMAGSVLFEFETENNSLKKTVEKAIKNDADLRYADLRYADLSSANLRSADLRSADLSSANLSSADLSSANLRSANLSSADLSSADLRSANLRMFRDDLWAVLSKYPTEAMAVIEALKAGKVDGTTYSGECACLVGTVANLKKCNVDDLEQDSLRPAEVWFLQIKKGDKPETNNFSKQAVVWIEEWLENMKAAFGKKQ